MSYYDFPQRVKAHIFTRVGPVLGAKIFNSIDEDAMKGYYESSAYSDSEEVADCIVKGYIKNDPEYRESARKEEEAKRAHDLALKKISMEADERKRRLKMEEDERKLIRTNLAKDTIEKLNKIKEQYSDIAIINGQWAEDIKLLCDLLLEGKGLDYLGLQVKEKEEKIVEKHKDYSKLMLASNVLLILAIVAFFIFLKHLKERRK